MKEETVIQNTKDPLTKEDLKMFLREIGIRNDDTLVVHTALSKLGFVIGGAQSVIEALLETLDKGTLVMPSHSGDLSNPEDFENPPVPEAWIDTMKAHMPPFNPETTPTRGMGKVASQFMAMKDTKRSYHPQVSFCAQGVNAETIIEDHALTPMFGMKSPLGRVYDLGGKIMMLGAPLSSCSAFHVSEVLSEWVGKKKEESPIIRDGEREWVTFEDYDYDDDDFLKIGDALRNEGLIQSFPLGLGEVHLMEARAVIDRGATLIRQMRKQSA
ncbi:MAG: aminoglycoside N(3)-acetyltransferase [Candidatus Izemoplasmataceae bacterium]